MSLFDRLFAKSSTVVLHVTSANGFHLRPAAVFVKKAQTFSCSVEAETRGKSVNAKHLNALLSLNLDKGDHFDLICRGKDAAEAMETLTQTFERLMHDEKETAPLKAKQHDYAGGSLQGEIITGGIAIAPLWYYQERTDHETSNVTFDDALAASLHELDTLYTAHQNQSDSTIYLAQKALLETLSEQCDSLETLERTVKQESEALRGGKMEAKITDYLDIFHRVRSHLGYRTTVDFPSTPFILSADDLLPSQVESLPETITGVVLKETSATSHTAILLRASGMPSLIVRTDLSSAADNVILDANAGVLVLTPTSGDLAAAEAALKKHEATLHKADTHRFETALTTSGQRVKVLANVTDPDSAKRAKEAGAEGVGLLRTEFLFQEHAPTFEEQCDAYRAIFDTFDDVTVRTLDVGGDKALPYIDLPQENNPFLGIRGVRLFKTHPEIIKTQLQAIFTAAKGRAVKIMFPMVSSVEEFNDAKAFALAVAQKEQINIDNIRFGIMVEVPSVLFQMKSFNEVVDFYSIGTNDLNQYLFAIERTHPSLTHDLRSNVLFDAVEKIVKGATKPVSLCGELAGDAQSIPELIRRGVTTLSLSAQQIPTIKETIRHV